MKTLAHSIHQHKTYSTIKEKMNELELGRRLKLPENIEVFDGMDKKITAFQSTLGRMNFLKNLFENDAAFLETILRDHQKNNSSLIDVRNDALVRCEIIDEEDFDFIASAKDDYLMMLSDMQQIIEAFQSGFIDGLNKGSYTQKISIKKAQERMDRFAEFYFTNDFNQLYLEYQQYNKARDSLINALSTLRLSQKFDPESEAFLDAFVHELKAVKTFKHRYLPQFDKRDNQSDRMTDSSLTQVLARECQGGTQFKDFWTSLDPNLKNFYAIEREDRAGGVTAHYVARDQSSQTFKVFWTSLLPKTQKILAMKISNNKTMLVHQLAKHHTNDAFETFWESVPSLHQQLIFQKDGDGNTLLHSLAARPSADSFEKVWSSLDKASKLKLLLTQNNEHQTFLHVAAIHQNDEAFGDLLDEIIKFLNSLDEKNQENVLGNLVTICRKRRLGLAQLVAYHQSGENFKKFWELLGKSARVTCIKMHEEVYYKGIISIINERHSSDIFDYMFKLFNEDEKRYILQKTAETNYTLFHDFIATQDNKMFLTYWSHPFVPADFKRQLLFESECRTQRGDWNIFNFLILHLDDKNFSTWLEILHQDKDLQLTQEDWDTLLVAIKDSEGFCALDVAIAYSPEKTTKLVTEYLSKEGYARWQSASPLVVSMTHPSSQGSEYTIKNNIKDGWGNPYITWKAFRGKTEKFQKYSSEIKKPYSRSHPLFWAIIGGQYESVKEILRLDPTLKDTGGFVESKNEALAMTAIKYLKKNGFDKTKPILEFFINNCNIGLKTKEGRLLKQLGYCQISDENGKTRIVSIKADKKSENKPHLISENQQAFWVDRPPMVQSKPNEPIESTSHQLSK